MAYRPTGNDSSDIQKVVHNMVTICNFVGKLAYVMSQQHFIPKRQYSERN